MKYRNGFVWWMGFPLRFLVVATGWLIANLLFSGEIRADILKQLRPILFGDE